MTLRRKAVIAACALLVLAGCGYGVQNLLNRFASERVAAPNNREARVKSVAIKRATCMKRGATVVLREGAARECVGITDGHYQFVQGNAAMVGVLNKIKAEDQWVRNRHAAFVSIAYLLPIIRDRRWRRAGQHGG